MEHVQISDPVKCVVATAYAGHSFYVPPDRAEIFRIPAWSPAILIEDFLGFPGKCRNMRRLGHDAFLKILLNSYSSIILSFDTTGFWDVDSVINNSQKKEA
jgi:hypothetical protein